MCFTGGTGRQTSGISDDKFFGQLQCDHSICGRERRRRKTRQKARDTHGCVSSVHSKHIRGHPLHPDAVDRRNCGSHPGIYSSSALLLYGKYLIKSVWHLVKVS